MQPKRNPYAPQTDDEKAKIEHLRKERERAREEAEEMAQSCLSDPKFIKYKKKYEVLERTTIDCLINYTESDPIRFAFNTRRMLDEIRQLRLLLRTVEKDAKKKGTGK